MIGLLNVLLIYYNKVNYINIIILSLIFGTRL